MKNNKGFSLVELIVVIAIMAILASVAVIGVSVYIPKAQQAADEQLAADIEYALELAVQAGELTPGDYVVIKADGAVAVFGNNNNNPDDTGATIDAAMKAAFGEKWTEELSLSWDGWEDEIGVAGDKNKMDAVYGSNFTPDNMGDLLNQVQGVVLSTKDFLANNNISASPEMVELLEKNGITLTNGKYDSTNSGAAANAYVYVVAGELGSIDLTNLDDTSTGQFLACWLPDLNAQDNPSFTTDGTWDVASNYAAEYARVYALALYLDSQTANKYGIAKSMDASTEPNPTTIASQALTTIDSLRSSDTAVETAYQNYYNDPVGDSEMPIAYNDAVSFLTYMQGVSDSSDSLLGSTNLHSDDYFIDGYIASYVNNYLTVSDILVSEFPTGTEGALVFVYDGIGVVCMPLDY